MRTEILYVWRWSGCPSGPVPTTEIAGYLLQVHKSLFMTTLEGLNIYSIKIRNKDPFPEDFINQLYKEEWET